MQAKVLQDAVKILNQTIKPGKFGPSMYVYLADGRITTTDVGNTVTVPLDGVNSDVTALVERAWLARTLKAIGNKGVVTLTGTTIEHEGYVYTIPEAEDVLPFYTGTPDVSVEHMATFDGRAFRDAVTRVAVALGKDEALPMLTGMLFAFDGNTVDLVASDRYRLAVETLALSGGVPDGDYLIPGEMLARASKHLTGDTVIMSVLDIGSVQMDSDGVRVTVQPLGAEYVKWQRVLELGDTNYVDFDREDAAAKIKKLVSTYPTGKRAPSPTVLLHVGGSRMVWSAPDVLAPSTPCDSGVEFHSYMHGPRLLDGLNAVPGDCVYLTFTTPHKAWMLTGEGSYRYLVMPTTQSEEWGR